MAATTLDFCAVGLRDSYPHTESPFADFCNPSSTLSRFQPNIVSAWRVHPPKESGATFAMKSRLRLPVKFWAASRNLANHCITQHLLAFLRSKKERQSPMVALPLLYSAWDFIFSQVPNCVNALYSTSPGTLTGLLEQAVGSYTALKAPQEGIKGFLV